MIVSIDTVRQGVVLTVQHNDVKSRYCFQSQSGTGTTNCEVWWQPGNFRKSLGVGVRSPRPTCNRRQLGTGAISQIVVLETGIVGVSSTRGSNEERACVIGWFGASGS